MSEYSVELKGLNKVYSNLLKEDTAYCEAKRPSLRSKTAAFRF